MTLLVLLRVILLVAVIDREGDSETVVDFVGVKLEEKDFEGVLDLVIDIEEVLDGVNDFVDDTEEVIDTDDDTLPLTVLLGVFDIVIDGVIDGEEETVTEFVIEIEDVTLGVNEIVIDLVGLSDIVAETEGLGAVP